MPFVPCLSGLCGNATSNMSNSETISFNVYKLGSGVILLCISDVITHTDVFHDIRYFMSLVASVASC